MSLFERFRKLDPDHPPAEQPVISELRPEEETYENAFATVNLDSEKELTELRARFINDALELVRQNDPQRYLVIAQNPAASTEIIIVLNNFRLLLQQEVKKRYDHKTALLSEVGYTINFQHLVRLAKETNTPLVAFRIDLNGFKDFNDKFGHPNGDKYLKKFAEVVTQVLAGRTYIAGRLSGDEFALLIPGIRAEEAQTIKDAINEILATTTLHIQYAEKNPETGEPEFVEKDPFLRKASIGFQAWTPQSDFDPMELDERADAVQMLEKQDSRRANPELHRRKSDDGIDPSYQGLEKS